ncbi:restriction endonuclease subunit S [Actinomadura sp. NTSP31]|uniref:restriction endonuclease subunit S n=1 Tax=Actinomadura sp. NTSP31 TaxID=1735447 RepID=UPI0035C02882
MTEWNRVRFDTLASNEKWSCSIGPFGSKVTTRDYQEHGIPFIRGNNLARGIFLDDDFVYISEEKATEVESAAVKSGDLVFTRKGTVGQVSMIPRRSKHHRYVISGSQVKVRLDERRAVPEFYYYWFKSEAGQQSILAHAVTTGVPSLANSLASIRGLSVPNPPLTEQTSIAAVLGALDDKIAINERIATTKEALLTCLFDQLNMVSDYQPNQGVPATEFVEFNPRTPRPSTSEAVYVDMAALSTDRAAIQSWTYREPKSGTKFMNGDTLLARITPCLENGKTGYVDFMGDDEIGVGSTEFIVMRARPGIPKYVSYFLARSRDFREHAIRNMIGSSGRQRVSAADAANFLVNRPDDQELTAFGEAAEIAFSYMQSLERENRTFAALRDTLLPELMSGRLRVRDAERTVEDAV